MRICASCGRILDDEDLTCPYCGTGGPDDSLPGFPEAAEAVSDAADVLPDGGLFPAEEAPAPVTESEEAADGPLSEEAPAEESVGEWETPEEEPETEEIPEEEPEDAAGVFESVEALEEAEAAEAEEADPEEAPAPTVFHERVAPEDAPLGKRSAMLPKILLIVLASLALLGTLLGIVLPAMRMNDDSDKAKEKAYMDFICGTWISNSFVYSDGSYPSKEILTVHRDYTYTSYIVVSPDGSDIYDKDTWTVTDRDEGKFSISIKDSAIAVTYVTTQGESYSYMRYIRRLDGTSLTLREYYNETMTDYFDVVFTRLEK